MVYDPPVSQPPCPICGMFDCTGFHFAPTGERIFQPHPLNEEDIRRIIREELEKFFNNKKPGGEQTRI